MKLIENHIIEYYQSNKFLGNITLDGIIDENEIGYKNKKIITSGEIVLKKKHKATEQNPIVLIKYNLYGKTAN